MKKTIIILAILITGLLSAQKTILGGVVVNEKIALADREAPTAPTGLTASEVSGDLLLNWTASTDNVAVTGYNVYNNDVLVVDALNNTSNVVISGTPSTTYNLTVRAYDARDNESVNSNLETITTITPADPTPPSAPTSLASSNVAETSLQLNWVAANDNVAVTNYKVYQDASEIASLGNVLTYDVTGLTASTSYDFTVTALDAATNESTVSNTETVSTTAGLAKTLDISAQNDDPRGIAFNDDGSRLYTSKNFNGIFSWDSGTNYAISTYTYDNVILPAQSSFIGGIDIVGTKLFGLDKGTGIIYQFSISGSTLTYDSLSYDASTEIGGNGTGITFSDDNTKLYIVINGGGNRDVHEYDITGGNFTVAPTYSGNEKGFDLEDTAPVGVIFNATGTKMIMLGDGSDALYSFTLSTPWNCSTATYDSLSFSIATETTIPRGIAVSADKTKIFIVDGVGGIESIYEYSLTGFDLGTITH